MGERWGAEWADCVNRFLDFEKACGYSETGPRIGGGDRPEEVKAWVKGGRKWFELTALDKASVGKIGEEGSFVERWWTWWRSLQPAERKWTGEGLSCPSGMKWGRMATLCGPNGYMQVMLALLWWGTAVAGTEEESDWTNAVADVDFAVGQMLASGEVK
ncbi:hypothetical protein C8R43DRAFT_906037 [Mycena crocata]|nr:hypothetical protein C8R43DRAFT_906037 [Mycena crocata]